MPYGPGCNIFDADLDGDVDGHDLRVLLVLLDGRADFDGDLDIDADDWTLFASCLSKPGVPLSAATGTAPATSETVRLRSARMKQLVRNIGFTSFCGSRALLVSTLVCAL